MMVVDLQGECKLLVDIADTRRATVCSTLQAVDKQLVVAALLASLVQPVIHLSPVWAEQPVVLVAAKALVVVAVLRSVADTADTVVVDTAAADIAAVDTVAADTVVVAELVELAIACSIQLRPEQQLPNRVDLELLGSWNGSLRNKLCRKFLAAPVAEQVQVEQPLPGPLEQIHTPIA